MFFHIVHKHTHFPLVNLYYYARGVEYENQALFESEKFCHTRDNNEDTFCGFGWYVISCSLEQKMFEDNAYTGMFSYRGAFQCE